MVKVRSFSQVTASSAIGRPESRRRVRKTLSISLSPNTEMVYAPLKRWSSQRAVAMRSEKPTTSLYHVIKVGSGVRVSSHCERGSMSMRSNSWS